MMDFSMPVCNGDEATRDIRRFIAEEGAGLAQPFICCLTSYKEK